MSVIYSVLFLSLFNNAALADDGTDFFNKCQEGVIPPCSELHGGYCCPLEMFPPIPCHGAYYAARNSAGELICVRSPSGSH